MLCNHISAVRPCGGEGALLMAEGEQKWNHRSLSHGHVHVCLFFLTFLPIHHPSAILWAACLFSLKQIGKQAFLAGRKLEGKDTWGRRGTCQLKNWSFFLTQAWLLSQSYEKLFLHSLAFKISLKTLCFCHQRAENPHWRPCLCFLSGRASTHNDEAWLPPQPTGLCSLLWGAPAPGTELCVWTAPRASTLLPLLGKTTEFIYLSAPLPLSSTAGNGNF